MQHFTPERALIAMGDLLDKAKRTITQKQYDEFKKEFVFEKLKGYTLGQAFCKKFQMADYMLSTMKDDDEIEFLIKHLGYIE